MEFQKRANEYDRLAHEFGIAMMRYPHLEEILMVLFRELTKGLK